MNENIRQSLLARNRAILDGILRRARRECAVMPELIAVTGSFASGEYYEKSDLDLLIVAEGETARALSHCFILGDVGFDIYCRSWARLEETAAYADPHGAVLYGEVVYAASDGARERYAALRERLEAHLRAPLCAEDLGKIDVHGTAALREYGRLCLSEGFGEARYAAAGVMLYTEYALYMLNKACICHGVRGVPREMEALTRLPADYAAARRALLAAADAAALREAAGRMLRGTLAEIAAARREIVRTRPLTADALRGTYEECVSNWGNKMRRAAAEGDAYLSLMSAASAQYFYEEIAGEAGAELPRVITDRPVSPAGAAEDFERALAQWRGICERAGTRIVRYADTEEFLREYAG